MVVVTVFGTGGLAGVAGIGIGAGAAGVGTGAGPSLGDVMNDGKGAGGAIPPTAEKDKTTFELNFKVKII